MIIKTKNTNEGIVFVVEYRDWDVLHGITMCLITLNEEYALPKLLETHKQYVDKVVAIDSGSTDGTLDFLASNVSLVKRVRFSGHFGNQKNRCIEMADTDWVLFLDSDEQLSPDALSALRGLIDQDEFDCVAFPRKNFIDGKRDMSHGDDYQIRLFRSYCRYIRPVHEELVGFKKKMIIDPSSEIFISHYKSGERHLARNEMYGVFESMHIHELGSPGKQSKNAFLKEYSSYFNTLEELKEKYIKE